MSCQISCEMSCYPTGVAGADGLEEKLEEKRFRLGLDLGKAVAVAVLFVITGRRLEAIEK